MSDWKYYSPSQKLASAGDLLRAIPSHRNLRLERIVVDGEEESIEAVRAAETLFGLSVSLRLLNDRSGSLTLTVREADRDDRREFEELDVDSPAPDDVFVYAEIEMPESTLNAGHLALADDVLSGLEQVFGGGIAWSPTTDEVVEAQEIAELMASEETPWTHLNVRLELDEEKRLYVTERLTDELPASMSGLLWTSDDALGLRGRFPASLAPDDYQTVWQTILELAPLARSGHVRFRRRGQWSEAVQGIGEQVADVPEEWARSRRGLRGVISRLFRRD